MKNRTAVLIALLLGLTGIAFAHSKKLDVYDGFDTSTLGTSWETDRFEPGAVEMQSEIVRAGHGAARITVHSHDIFEKGQNGNSDTERAELREARAFTSRENEPYEFSFSMFFPKDFPIVPTRLVIAQWKQHCPHDGPCQDDSPVLALRYINGELLLTQDLAKKRIILYRQKDEYRNRWLDFKFRVRFSPTDTGRIQCWLDGKPLADYHGITANPENPATGYTTPSYYYFKMGLYRNVMTEPMSVYIDEYHKRQLKEEEF